MANISVTNESIDKILSSSGNQPYMKKFVQTSCEVLSGDLVKEGKARIKLEEPFSDYILEAEFKCNEIDGQVLMFNDKRIKVASMTIKNGRREGLVVEYDAYGSLVSEIHYLHDKKEGVGKSYENGVVKEIFCCKDDKKVIIYEKMDSVYTKELDANTSQLIAISKLDEDYKRNGMCFFYENEKISKIQKFENGEMSQDIAYFEGPTMHQLDESGNEIYRGGYLDSFESQYLRDGKGEEFDINHSLIYFGDFKDNHREGHGMFFVNGRKQYEGNWENDYPSNEGIFFNEKGEAQYSGQWECGYFHIEKGKWIDYASGNIEKVKDKKYLKKWRLRGGEYESDLRIMKEKMSSTCTTCCVAVGGGAVAAATCCTDCVKDTCSGDCDCCDNCCDCDCDCCDTCDCDCDCCDDCGDCDCDCCDCLCGICDDCDCCACCEACCDDDGSCCGYIIAIIIFLVIYL